MTQATLDFEAATDQASRILAYLQAGHTLTPLDSLRLFGCLRLGGRIYDLKKLGYPIISEMVRLPNGKRVASYKLENNHVR